MFSSNFPTFLQTDVLFIKTDLLNYSQAVSSGGASLLTVSSLKETKYMEEH